MRDGKLAHAHIDRLYIRVSLRFNVIGMQRITAYTFLTTMPSIPFQLPFANCLPKFPSLSEMMRHFQSDRWVAGIQHAIHAIGLSWWIDGSSFPGWRKSKIVALLSVIGSWRRSIVLLNIYVDILLDCAVANYFTDSLNCLYRVTRAFTNAYWTEIKTRSPSLIRN